MKMVRRYLLLFICILIITMIIPSVTAFTVTSTKVDPLGAQVAGTPMTVTAILEFSSEGNETFPPDGELLMSTDLDNPRWVPLLLLKTGETRLGEKTKGTVVLPGWYFSYPSTERVQMKLTLTGAMPQDPSPDKNFLRIQELKADESIVSTAHVAMPAAPITRAATPAKKPSAPPTTDIIPPETTPQKSPVWSGAGILAVISAAILVMRQK